MICYRFDKVRPMVSHIEVCLLEKSPTPKNIGEAFNGSQRQFWKKDLFMKYNKNKSVILTLDTIPIKSLPEGKKVPRLLISTSIKEGGFSDGWTFVARHCSNGSSQIQGINFYESYSPVLHADSFRINIAIADMHRLTARIFYVSNLFQNKNVPIYEIVCVIPPPYYIDWFEIYYPNFPLSRDEVIFCLRCINGIQGTKPYRQQYNQILDAVVTIIKYKKIRIDHAIYIIIFYDDIMSYLIFFTDDVLNTTNNETAFTELTRFFEE